MDTSKKMNINTVCVDCAKKKFNSTSDNNSYKYSNLNNDIKKDNKNQDDEFEKIKSIVNGC
jgi:hypothetical protein